MSKVEVDMEKLEVMTQARVDYVLDCYSLGLPVNWVAADAIALQSANALSIARLYEPFREIGRAARIVVEHIRAIGEALSDGYSESP